jgi:hypothetical protein
MKFESSALPLLPTQQELNEINDLLLSAMELYQTYATLERHPRVTGAAKSVELFTSCREQLHQDISLLDKQLETLLTLSRASAEEDATKTAEERAALVPAGEVDPSHPLLLIPDVEPTDMKQSVFEIMRKAFHTEDLFSDQLNACLRSAQNRKHLKLELQLKMIILSADQRCHLLEDRYGYARTKNLLFQGLRRQTTRFLSALSGENRTDIDR